MLESDETSGWFKLSPKVGLTIEQANELLRLLGIALMIGNVSGVIRFDAVELPSNLIPEDRSSFLSMYVEGEISSMMFGIYDGHA